MEEGDDQPGVVEYEKEEEEEEVEDDQPGIVEYEEEEDEEEEEDNQPGIVEYEEKAAAADEEEEEEVEVEYSMDQQMSCYVCFHYKQVEEEVDVKYSVDQQMLCCFHYEQVHMEEEVDVKYLSVSTRSERYWGYCHVLFSYLHQAVDLECRREHFIIRYSDGHLTQGTVYVVMSGFAELAGERNNAVIAKAMNSCSKPSAVNTCSVAH